MDTDDTKMIPRSFRFQKRIIDLATSKAKHLGMKLPAYLSQLIVKDNQKKS